MAKAKLKIPLGISLLLTGLTPIVLELASVRDIPSVAIGVGMAAAIIGAIILTDLIPRTPIPD